MKLSQNRTLSGIHNEGCVNVVCVDIRRKTNEQNISLCSLHSAQNTLGEKNEEDIPKYSLVQFYQPVTNISQTIALFSHLDVVLKKISCSAVHITKGSVAGESLLETITKAPNSSQLVQMSKKDDNALRHCSGS